VGHSHLSRLALRRTISSFAFAAVVLAPALSLARSLEQVKETGTLRVTVYRNYKPYSWTENGKLKGIDVDIGASLAKSLGVKVDYLDLLADDTINDDLRNGVWKGTVVGGTPGDVMLHVPFDHAVEAKNDLIKLAAPYHDEGLALAVDAEKAGQAQDFSLFETEKVAVDIGTISDIILISARDHKLVNNVVHVRGVDKAAAAYSKGEVTAFYGEASAVETFVGDVKRPTKVLYPEQTLAKPWTLGLAVRVNANGLAPALEKSIEDMKATGEMQKIFAAYGVTWKNPPPVK